MSRQLSMQLLKNFVLDLAYVNMGNKTLLKPLIVTYGITQACNFNCNYCSYAKSKKIIKTKDELDTAEAKKLLGILRKSCPNLHITGGEPLMRKDIVDILMEAKKLNFKMISMITNMSLMHTKLEILDYLSVLSFSLDMLDTKKYSGILGVPEITTQKILDNAKMCAALQKEKGYKMYVNFVANNDTLPHVEEVIEFCIDNKIQFTFGPALDINGYIEDGIPENPLYNKALDYIIEMKDRSPVILGTKYYYNILKSSGRFVCYPSLIPRIYYNGNLAYPCLKFSKESKLVNLLEVGDYKKALRLSEKNNLNKLECDKRCFQNCYIEPSILVKKPVYLKEYM